MKEGTESTTTMESIKEAGAVTEETGGRGVGVTKETVGSGIMIREAGGGIVFIRTGGESAVVVMETRSGECGVSVTQEVDAVWQLWHYLDSCLQGIREGIIIL